MRWINKLDNILQNTHQIKKMLSPCECALVSVLVSGTQEINFGLLRNLLIAHFSFVPKYIEKMHVQFSVVPIQGTEVTHCIWFS